jgi:hypothetical protein
MATKPAGKGISKRVGPLPYWGWAAAALGSYVIYRYIKARQAAAALSAASGTTGGTLIPNDIGLPASASTLAGTFSSVASWEQALLANLVSQGMNPADALNAATSFLNGNCVSQVAYNGIATAVESNNVGLPPGFTSTPTLSVCPAVQQTSTTTTPPTTTAPPLINSQLWPLKVLYGQYGPNDYTKIGQVQNGVIIGKNVAAGAPVYANVYGGFVQDFNLATLPNGTGIYVPTSLSNYIY